MVNEAEAQRHTLIRLVGHILTSHPEIGEVLTKNTAHKKMKDDMGIIVSNGATFFGDGFATTHLVGFLRDPKFVAAYGAAWEKIEGPTIPAIFESIKWRAHIVTWAANQALKLEGDFVECGVSYGILSNTICNYIDFDKLSRKFYLFDTWGGPGGDNHPADILDTVKARFARFKNVEFVKGAVPQTLDLVNIEKISYLSIDMNGAEPERAVLERFYDKIVPGGVIYFDDYGWGYKGQVETIEEFFADKPETLLHFPSGNSIVVKQ